MAAVVRNRFYPQLALVLALLVIVAFSRTYYLRFLTDQPPLVMLVHLHGLAFTAWLALFVAQTRLVATNRVDLHMKLGIAGIVLAALVVLVGLATTFHTAALPRLRPSGLTPPQFSAVPFMSLVLFSLFVALGVTLRRRATLHKRFMVLAMIAVIGPAVARLMTLFEVRAFFPFAQPAVAAGFVAWCLIHDWRRNRIVHPVFVIGGLGIVASWPLRLAIATSEWWQPVGAWVAKVGEGI